MRPDAGPWGCPCVIILRVVQDLYMSCIYSFTFSNHECIRRVFTSATSSAEQLWVCEAGARFQDLGGYGRFRVGCAREK